MGFSPFLSVPSHSDSCGDGSPTSPRQPQTIIRAPTNSSFLLHQTFGLLNPNSLNTNDLFLHTGSSSPSVDYFLNRQSFPASDFQASEKNNKQRAESRVSCESSNMMMSIEGVSRACRYSPEEKKQRIERYRTKRNHRNFNKKIKYACRKSLADSRPRIRGRFARYNDDVVQNYPVQWSHGREEEEEEANGGDNWMKYFIDAYSANLIP